MVRLGCPGLTIVEEAVFGKTGAHKRLAVQDAAGNRQSVIWWGGAAEVSPQGEFDLALTVGPDDFSGGGAVQVVWLAARQWTPRPLPLNPNLLHWRQTESPISNLHSPNLPHSSGPKAFPSPGPPWPETNSNPPKRCDIGPLRRARIFTGEPSPRFAPAKSFWWASLRRWITGRPLSMQIRWGWLSIAVYKKKARSDLEALAAGSRPPPGHGTIGNSIGWPRWASCQFMWMKTTYWCCGLDSRPPRPEAAAVDTLL